MIEFQPILGLFSVGAVLAAIVVAHLKVHVWLSGKRLDDINAEIDDTKTK